METRIYVWKMKRLKISGWEVAVQAERDQLGQYKKGDRLTHFEDLIYIHCSGRGGSEELKEEKET